MTKIISQNLKQYMKEISSLIPNVYSNKSQFLSDIKHNIVLYVKENPDTTWDDILLEFGSPSEVAGSILAEHEDLNRSGIVKPRLHLHFFIIAICVTIILSIFAFQYYWTHYGMYKKNSTRYVYHGVEVSSEEFEQLTND